MSHPPRDRFDSVARTAGRVGAYRAENPKMNGWVVLLWAVVGVIVLTVVGTFAALIVTGRIDPFPDVSETAGPQPGVTGEIDVSYSVLILNGTSQEGLGDLVREQVINAGWSGSDVYAGPSGTDDFDRTTVYYVDDTDQAAAVGLADLLGGVETARSDFYVDPENPDALQLTVVIGVDKMTTPSS